MTNRIDIDNAKSYATEKNLEAALERLGLADHGCRYMVVRNSAGRWTAIFMVSEWLRANGGYAGFASYHGFMSV